MDVFDHKGPVLFFLQALGLLLNEYWGIFVLQGMSLFVTLWCWYKIISVFQKKIWIVYALVSSLALALTMLIIKLKLSDVASDVIAYHQMTIVVVVTLFLLLVKKEAKEFKQLKWQDCARFLIAAVFNAGLMIFRYKALSYSDCIPTIISVIITCEFVLVSIVTILFFKAQNKKAMSLLISMVISGMAFVVMAGLI